MHYQIFGLTVQSEIELPELPLQECAEHADVIVKRGVVAPQRRAGATFDGQSLLLAIPGTAKFKVSGGSEIFVDQEQGAPDRSVRLYLLGSAFAGLLHQRGFLPLHATAVEILGRAVLFMGQSGSGKSTLAAWFHDKGYPVLADDVSAICQSADGGPLALPGLPRIRLWKDALQATGRDPAEHERSDPSDEAYEKYDVLVAARRMPSRPLPVSALYLLEGVDEFRIQPLSGVGSIEALFDHTYRGEFVRKGSQAARHWRACVELGRRVAVFRAMRRWGLKNLASDASLLLEHGRSQSGLNSPRLVSERNETMVSP